MPSQVRGESSQDRGEPSQDPGDLDGAGPRFTLGDGLRVVWAGIRMEPRMFAFAVAGSTAYGVGTSGSGWLLGRVTDRVVAPAFASGHGTARQAWMAGGGLALVALVTAIGVVIRRAAGGATMFRLQARGRRRVTRQYLRLPLSWHHQHPTGQLLSNANADVEATWQVFAPLPMSLGVLVMITVAVVAMLIADPVLGSVGLVVLPALFSANAVYQRRMSPLVTRVQAKRAEVSSVAHESFEAAVVVKTLGLEAAETERFAIPTRQLRDANVAVGRMRGIFDPVIEAIPTLGTLAVLALGTARVAAGATATGNVVEVAYILTLVSFPVRALGWVLAELPRAVVGWRRVSAVLAATGGLTYGQGVPGGSGAAQVSADRVGYAYPAPDGERVPTLHEVTLEVPAGRTVALVGPTGSGKSTLVGVLVRLVDPDTGQVLLDGVDLRELRAGALPAAVGLVPQSTFIFDDSVRGNVALDADVDDEQVWAALRAARADGFVSALPSGLDTRVGERGTTLSGGQRQRLALARALVRRPRLVVLDDATSAVDPRIEAEILAGLHEAAGGRPAGTGAAGADPVGADPVGADPVGAGTTVLVVAYRMATIALADEVVYLEHGRVLDRGRHADLLERSPGYRRLVTAYQRDLAERTLLRSRGSVERDQEVDGATAGSDPATAEDEVVA